MARKDGLVKVRINTRIRNKLLASYNKGSALQKFVDMSIARIVSFNLFREKITNEKN